MSILATTSAEALTAGVIWIIALAGYAIWVFRPWNDEDTDD